MLTPVIAVASPVIENEEGVSVCVPGAYVKGIDTDGDSDTNARHWSEWVLKVLRENQETLEGLFNR